MTGSQTRTDEVGRKELRRATMALMFMVMSLALSTAITPTHRIARDRPIQLNSMIPNAFGDWQELPAAQTAIVNPQQAETLSSIYSQLLSRTYVHRATGTRIMLSVAYGEDQRDGMQLHYPEVCYPAQGFELISSRKDVLKTPSGPIPVKRLTTTLARQRYEPVTYWTMLGNRAVLGGTDKKLAELHYGLHRQIPDGLLFRVSSISADTEAAFEMQNRFLVDLLGTMTPEARQRLAGLSP